MLHEFLTHNRDELVQRCRSKVAMRRAPRATPHELSHGVPLFLDQLIQVFPRSKAEAGTRDAGVRTESGEPLQPGQQIAQSATEHGEELLKYDFTIEQVVHDYGDLCQAITELAAERKAPITVQEFGSLNITLDNAIAAAVSSYSAQHKIALAGDTQLAAQDRLGVLANAMRNLINTAILAASAMKRGSVGLGGATAAALDRSLVAMRGLVDRTLAEVRLESGPIEATELIEVGPFIADVQLSAVFAASSTQCQLTVVVEPDLFVRGDRHLLAAALATLLHGAMSSTESGGGVFLTARAAKGRVIIDVEDACPGLAPEVLRERIERFENRDGVGGGAGSALESARRAVEANSGTLSARVVPGQGCLYTLDLPEAR
jgi:hypothetical protein